MSDAIAGTVTIRQIGRKDKSPGTAKASNPAMHTGISAISH